MKIAMVAHGVGDESLLGGPGPVAVELANGLWRRGHDVRIVTTDLVWKGRRAVPPSFTSVEPSGPEVAFAKAWSLASWPGSIGPILSPGSSVLVRRAVEWADVVHCHEWAYSTVQQARRLSLRHRKAFVVQPHGSIQPRAHGWKSAIHAGFNSVYRSQPTDMFIALSGAEASEIRSVLGGRTRVREMPNPMSLPDLKTLGNRAITRRRSWSCPDGADVLLYAHRLAPNKGLDIAIGALEYLPPEAHLIVVGPDSVDQRFTQYCKDLAVRIGAANRVKFVGSVHRHEMVEVIRAGDVFILPARRDTFPMSVLQAMACGRPTVITDTCQCAGAVAPAVAISAPTPEDFAQTIANLGREDRIRLSAAGPKLIADQFAPERVVAKLEEIYLEALLDGKHNTTEESPNS